MVIYSKKYKAESEVNWLLCMFVLLTLGFVFPKEIPQVLKDVSGIPWGIYAGSPADPKPSIQLVQPLQSHVGSMMTFSLNEVAIISPSTVVYTVRTKKGILSYFVETL